MASIWRAGRVPRRGGPCETSADAPTPEGWGPLLFLVRAMSPWGGVPDAQTPHGFADGPVLWLVERQVQLVDVVCESLNHVRSIVHTPDTHAAVMLGEAPHIIPQPPQLAVVVRSVSQPLALSPSQSP
jgi:hypothetical protein